MLRTLARFLGIWLLAAALVVAVIDGAKSLAASEVVVTDMAGAIAMAERVLPGDAAMQAPPAAPADGQGLGPADIFRVAPAAPLLALRRGAPADLRAPRAAGTRSAASSPPERS